MKAKQTHHPIPTLAGPHGIHLPNHIEASLAVVGYDYDYGVGYGCDYETTLTN